MNNKNTNPQYEFINKKYLQKVSRPSFAKFSAEHEKEIVTNQQSFLLRRASSCNTKDPNNTKTSAVFRRVYIQAKALKNTRAQVSAASIMAIGDQAESSVRLLQRSNSASGGDSINDEEEEEEQEEEQEEAQEEVQEEGIQNYNTEEEEDAHYASEVRNMASLKLLYPKRKVKNLNISANQHNKTISHILCKKAHSILKQNTIDHLSTELLKLSLSNILNFANPQLRYVYRSIIPPEEMKNIDYSRQQKKMELAFDNEMNSVIDNVIDKLKLDTITTTNTDTLHTMIDELKHKESDKHSSNYQVLNAVEMVVKNLRFWSNASPKSELTYLRKFEGLLEVIMDDTELMLSDGESVCISTRDSLRSMLEESENTEYGRRIDLLVRCAHSETTVELCSIEFKREDANKSLVIHQQSKNSRVNSCILSSINSLTKDPTNQILAFDFAGNNGYMIQIYRYKDVLISQKINGLHIPTHILELDHLRSTLKHLYLWKLYLVKLASTVIKSVYRNKRKYAFVETSEDDSRETDRHTPPPISLNNVFMTPHRSTL
ncbi:unnamed protein product [Rhizopus stolonifer]